MKGVFEPLLQPIMLDIGVDGSGGIAGGGNDEGDDGGEWSGDDGLGF